MTALDYPRKDLLVSPQWLFSNLNNPELKIVDAGNWLLEETRLERIPGAISPEHPYVKSGKDKKLVADPHEFETIARDMGISSDSRIVIYDSANSLNAARFWWVLNYYNISNVSILNGGFDKWKENYPTTTQIQQVLKSNYSAVVNQNVLSTISSMNDAIEDTDATIWDTRTFGEYSGETPRGNSRAGHVPSAIHFEWKQMMNEDSTFKNADEIQEILNKLGIIPNKRIHTY